jgi:hypothetical protein
MRTTSFATPETQPGIETMLANLSTLASAARAVRIACNLSADSAPATFAHAAAAPTLAHLTMNVGRITIRVNAAGEWVGTDLHGRTVLTGAGIPALLLALRPYRAARAAACTN